MFLCVIEHLDSASDIELVKKLYEEYMPFLRKRVYSHTKDMNICEDLAHDCMINMITHLDTIKSLPESKVRSYFSVSINHVIINYSKRESRKVSRSESDLSDDYYLAEDYSLEEEVERKYEYQTLRNAFEELNDRDQSIIKMKYDLELKDKHMSEILNIKQDSVRMTVLRSIERLKKFAKKQDG